MNSDVSTVVRSRMHTLTRGGGGQLAIPKPMVLRR